MSNNLDLSKTLIALSNQMIVKEHEDLTHDNEQLAVSLQAKLMERGFILSKEAFNYLKASSKEAIIDFWNTADPYLAEVSGSKLNYTPLLQGFPSSVLAMEEVELFLKAQIYYWTNGLIKPYEEVPSHISPAFENETYTDLNLVEESEFLRLFTDIVSINQSLSPRDLQTLKWFAKNYDEDLLIFPETLPFKENLSILAAYRLQVPVTTPTDVLRVASFLSNGDSTLSNKKAKFCSFSRKDRRYLLSLLEKTHLNPMEMAAHREQWLRLGERLHANEKSYRKIFPKAAKAFKTLQDTKVQTWYSKLNKKLESSYLAGITFLSQRPGEFARALDAMLRRFPEKTQKTLELFEYIALEGKGISNKVLFELYRHFHDRNTKQAFRSIFIKGRAKSIQLPILEPLENETVETIISVIKRVLLNRFSAETPLGKVWIDPDLKKIPLPSNMRSTSFNIKPTIRGERIKFSNKDAKVARAFIHWNNLGNQPKGCDIDLSGFITNADTSKMAHCAWNTSWSVLDGASLYSGDVMDREGACAEYIDFNIEKCLKGGYRYAIIDLRDYRRNPGGLGSYDDCYFGVMLRDKQEASKTFVPSTTALGAGFKVTTPEHSVIAACLDLEEREWFMIDAQGSGHVASKDGKTVLDMLKIYGSPPAFSAYDLLTLHAESRGEHTDDKDKADTLFGYEDFTQSYVKIAQYMGI